MFAKTVTELAHAIRERHLGVKELAQCYLDRIGRVDGPEGLNAVAEINEGMLEQARRMDARTANRDGSLFGLPILVKDNIDVAGLCAETAH